MRTTHITARAGVARRLRTAAAAVGLLALLAAFAPNAVAAESDQTFSASQLRTASDAVLDADVAGTAWSIDEESGQVTVLADERVSKADIAKIRSTAGALAGAITVENVDGAFQTHLLGGDPIYSDSGSRCSLGFNVVVRGVYAFVTAGHCTSGTTRWHNGSSWIGETWHTYFPGRDHGLVRHVPQVAHPSAVRLPGGQQAITSVGNAMVGQAACRVGSTTGLRCGSVTALNQSVNYGNGFIVHGLIRTNICAEPGDSGGPLFAGNVGLGILSGGSGNCSVGGTTFYEPLTRIMSYYGATLS
ncbi:S1 family peptidase [Streptomyces sp. ACA25]|uniref:S1 family peptidase n=1 Tax=Streptomyces sp. ACA25 TaxID=3022596 RepID=UPI002307CC76|nr:S1 family peptidase [Streptomyces sp. ACA25]MDB1088099.1 S1 family peptidase [Streptomyces sp. ACA25]